MEWYLSRTYREPALGPGVRRWLCRLMHLELARLVGDRLAQDDHDDLIEAALALVMQHPGQLIYWADDSEHRGPRYSCGAWKFRPRWREVLAGLLRQAGQGLDATEALDDWLKFFEEGVLFDQEGPKEPAAETLWPGGATAWKARRKHDLLRRRSKCKGCGRHHLELVWSARYRTHCFTCRPPSARIREQFDAWCALPATRTHLWCGMGREAVQAVVEEANKGPSATT